MTSGDAARRNATRPLRSGTELGDYVTASVSAYEPPRSAVFEVKEAKLGDKVLPVETPRGPYEVALRIVADAIAVDSGTGKDDRWWGRRRLQDRAGRILGAASGDAMRPLRGGYQGGPARNPAPTSSPLPRLA